MSDDQTEHMLGVRERILAHPEVRMLPQEPQELMLYLLHTVRDFNGSVAQEAATATFAFRRYQQGVLMESDMGDLANAAYLHSRGVFVVDAADGTVRSRPVISNDEMQSVMVKMMLPATSGALVEFLGNTDRMNRFAFQQVDVAVGDAIRQTEILRATGRYSQSPETMVQVGLGASSGELDFGMHGRVELHDGNVAYVYRAPKAITLVDTDQSALELAKLNFQYLREAGIPLNIARTVKSDGLKFLQQLSDKQKRGEAAPVTLFTAWRFDPALLAGDPTRFLQTMSRSASDLGADFIASVGTGMQVKDWIDRIDTTLKLYKASRKLGLDSALNITAQFGYEHVEVEGGKFYMKNERAKTQKEITDADVSRWLALQLRQNGVTTRSGGGSDFSNAMVVHIKFPPR